MSAGSLCKTGMAMEQLLPWNTTHRGFLKHLLKLLPLQNQCLAELGRAH